MTTLPGTVTSSTAGPLLRRGAPVVVSLWNAPATVVEIVAGTTPNEGDDPALGKYADRYRVCGSVNSWEYGRDLVLNLTDPAGMDIAARWLARHHGLTVGATAPVWQRIKGMDPSTIWSLSVRSDIDMDASPTVKVDQRGFVEPGAFPDSPIATVVPGISALTDPAAALRLACLAAVESTWTRTIPTQVYHPEVAEEDGEG